MAWVVQVLAANLNLMIGQELDGRAVFTKQYRCALNRCPACFHMRKHSVFAMRSDLSIGEGQTGDVSPLARPLIEANNQGESFIDGSRRKFQFTGRPISVATQWRRANWRIGLIPRQPIGVQESKVVVEASANCFPGQLAAHRTALKQCVQEKVLGWLQWHALVVNQQRKAFYRPATNFQITSRKEQLHRLRSASKRATFLKLMPQRCMAKSSAPTPPQLARSSQNFGPVQRISRSLPATEACQRDDRVLSRGT